MKKLIILATLLTTILTVTGCQTGPETPPPQEVDDTKKQENLIPEESSDEYDVNLENSLMELDLVE